MGTHSCDLEVQASPTLNRTRAGVKQGNEDGSHGVHAMLERQKSSRIPRMTNSSSATAGNTSPGATLMSSGRVCWLRPRHG